MSPGKDTKEEEETSMAKQFFYTGIDYKGDKYMERYTRAGRWAKIDYTMSGVPFFRYNNRRYKLDDFISMSSDWSVGLASTIKAADGETVVLSGYESDNYYKTLFIEVSEGGEAVRVYRYEGTETE